MTQARRVKRRRANELHRLIAGHPQGRSARLNHFRQAHLPMPWRPVRPFRAVEFAHPAEAEFARILSVSGVRWSYEPTTFVLSRKADGTPLESFAPDFYLPEQRVYIEITTMRQRLVTRKNGKVRRLRALHPTVRIKPLYRRDMQRLVLTHGSAHGRAKMGGIGAVVFSAGEIAERVATLAVEIHEFSTARTGLRTLPPLLIHLGGGRSPFFAELVSSLQAMGGTIDPYPLGCVPGPDAEVRGREVLLVADIVSTGLTLARMRRALFRRGAVRIDVCTLIDREGARVIETPLRFVGFRAPDDLLAGYGLRHSPDFSDLPYVAILESTAQSPTGPAPSSPATPASV